MSGHSHWATIKHKKAASDAKKGNVISKMIKQIFILVKEGGPDAGSNPALRLLMQKARQAGVNKDNIDRAIARASGQGADGIQMEEVVYEAYAPGGAALIVSCVTDNKNRTTPEIRSIIEKRGGKMANSGSVAWMFKRKGVITVKTADVVEDKLMEVVLEAGAEDVETGGDFYTVTTAPEDKGKVEAALEKAGIKTETAEINQEAENKVQLDIGAARRVVTLMGELDEQDDVNNVYTNFEMTAELAAELAKG
jgi:YebC/PmpR family DNA-binding regulatory protein